MPRATRHEANSPGRTIRPISSTSGEDRFSPWRRGGIVSFDDSPDALFNNSDVAWCSIILFRDRTGHFQSEVFRQKTPIRVTVPTIGESNSFSLQMISVVVTAVLLLRFNVGEFVIVKVFRRETPIHMTGAPFLWQRFSVLGDGLFQFGLPRRGSCFHQPVVLSFQHRAT